MNEGRREKKKDGMQKCVLEHITVITVRLGAYYSDYGVLGSILQ